MQPDFFDLNNRHQELEKLGDQLPKLAELVDWEGFRTLFGPDPQKRVQEFVRAQVLRRYSDDQDPFSAKFLRH